MPPPIPVVVMSLQHTATHCNTVQHGATRRHTLQHSATHNKLFFHASCSCDITATHRNTLQHTAIHCNILQHTAPHCTTLHHTATHCSTLQHTATSCSRFNFQHPSSLTPPPIPVKVCHCNTLQHTATHCNTLQHTATQIPKTATDYNRVHHCWRCKHPAPILLTNHCQTPQNTATPHCNLHRTNYGQTGTHCDTLHSDTAAHHKTLQHRAATCIAPTADTLQHT